MIQGTLIPIGGNEDKGTGSSEIHTLDFIGEGILAHVVKESGGNRAKIVIVPTASSIPVEVANNYLNAFAKLGCHDLHVMDLRSKEQSQDPANLRIMEQADCVMFSGGDQSKIVDYIGNTIMHDLLLDKYRNSPFVIAGTSAGAMAMSQEMIAGGRITEALFKGSVEMKQGMGFVSELIIDSHFIQRGRFGRLAEACARFPHLLGMGLAEDTGVVIKNGSEAKVIGSGMVVLFNASKLTHNNENVLETGTPMSMANLIVHILANGDRFNFVERKLEILPLEAEFE